MIKAIIITIFIILILLTIGVIYCCLVVSSKCSNEEINYEKFKIKENKNE